MDSVYLSFPLPRFELPQLFLCGIRYLLRRPLRLRMHLTEPLSVLRMGCPLEFHRFLIE